MIRRPVALSTEMDFEVNIWSGFVRKLLPPICLLCGAPGAGRDLCACCAGDLPRNLRPCTRCGVPLEGGHAAVCGRCLRHPPAYDALQAPFVYAPPLASLVTGLKFRTRLAHARLLGELLAEACTRAERPECLLPVPLHPARLRERGFNQALEIARPVAARLDIPLHPRLLRRTRPTAAQSGLAARARRANVRGAFALAGPLPGRRVALVDDVVTTGNTVEEIARVLRQAGAERIEVWAVARAAPA